MQEISELIGVLQRERETLKPMLSALDVTAGLALEGEEEPFLELNEQLRHVRAPLFDYFDDSARLARLAYRHRIPGAAEEATHLLESSGERRRWLERAFGDQALQVQPPVEQARKARLLVEWARIEMRVEQQMAWRTLRWQSARQPASEMPQRQPAARWSVASPSGTRSLVAPEPHLPQGRSNEVLAHAYATATAAALGAAAVQRRARPERG